MVNKPGFPDGPHGGSILSPLRFNTPHHTHPASANATNACLASTPNLSAISLFFVQALFLYFPYSDVKCDEIDTETQYHRIYATETCRI